jgi:hypothetical protein
MSLIRGSSHRRKGAASHIIHMVWLYRLVAYRSGDEGVLNLITCLRGAYTEKEEGVSTLWSGVLNHLDRLFTSTYHICPVTATIFMLTFFFSFYKECHSSSSRLWFIQDVYQTKSGLNIHGILKCAYFAN